MNRQKHIGLRMFLFIAKLPFFHRSGGNGKIRKKGRIEFVSLNLDRLTELRIMDIPVAAFLKFFLQRRSAVGLTVN